MNELLSPAGSIESFYSAISAGCNAVYLGLDKFNARAYANNFNIYTLKELVEFAHLRNVKVYVTMNTILYDNELSEAFKNVDELAKIHVDAIIVQDLALLFYTLNKYKSLEVHVSTQVGIDDIYGATLLKKLGVKRIVFARETSLKTLKEIKNTLNIEVEAFIHGALCVSYSGNCLMSSMIGERSGNRGRCAGCCRQLYTLIDTTNNKNIQNGYLLSMKDLNISNNINDFNFIDSLKIEGRMKDSLYVGSVTYFYRQLLDNKKIDLNNFNKIFNRTYTKGFINNESSSSITNINRPNNIGELIGEIVKINKNKVWIKLLIELNIQDSIRIERNNLNNDVIIPIQKMFDANFNLVNNANKIAVIYLDKKVNLKDKVYKIKDAKLNKEIYSLLKNKEYKKLNIDMSLSAKLNEPILLKIIYNNFVAYAKSTFLPQKAISSITTYENIYNQLNKLNDTPYKINNINIELDDNLFIPLKIINELRRNALNNLNNQRLNKKIVYNKSPISLSLNGFKDNEYKQEISVQVSTIEQYQVAKSLNIKHIYFKNIINRNNVTYKDIKETEILIGGLGSVEYYKNKNKYLISDYSFNVSNYQSVNILHKLGVNKVTLSLEISKNNINDLITNYFNEYKSYPNLELIVYGRLKLMHSKYCVFKRLNMCGKCKENNYVLKDKFEQFPLTFNEDCTMNILNSKIFNIIDYVDDIKGISSFRLIFTKESKEETYLIISSLIDKLNNINDKLTFNKDKHTKGHFIKSAL